MTTAGNATIGGTVTISGNCSVTGTIKSGTSGYYSLEKNSATIGGWTITTNCINNGGTYLYSDGKIILKDGGHEFSIGNGTAHPYASGLNVGSGGIHFSDNSGINNAQLSGDWSVTGAFSVGGVIKADSLQFNGDGRGINFGPDLAGYVYDLYNKGETVTIYLSDGANRKTLTFTRGILTDLDEGNVTTG